MLPTRSDKLRQFLIFSSPEMSYSAYSIANEQFLSGRRLVGCKITVSAVKDCHMIFLIKSIPSFDLLVKYVSEEYRTRVRKHDR